jgi:hypothetical protein
MNVPNERVWMVFLRALGAAALCLLLSAQGTAFAAPFASFQEEQEEEEPTPQEEQEEEGQEEGEEQEEKGEEQEEQAEETAEGEGEEAESSEETEEIEDIEDTEEAEGDVSGEEEPVEELEELDAIEDVEDSEAAEGEPVEELDAIEDVEGIEDVSVEEAPPAPVAEEEPGEETPAEEKAGEEKAEEEKKKEGLTFWKGKIRVRGVAMARAVHAPGLAEPFSGLTLLAEPSPFVRYPNDDMQNGATISDIPHVGLSVTTDFTPDWRFHLHLGYNPQLPDEKNYNEHYDDNGKVSVFEAYVRLRVHSDYFKQPFHVRAGRIAPMRFSREHQTPMRTSRYLVTPSPISAFLNNIYGYGADVSFGFEKRPIGAFALGLIEGNYFYTLPLDVTAVKHYWPMTDAMSDPSRDNSQITGRPGAYALVSARDSSGHYSAHGGYYWNGISHSEDRGHTLRVATGSVAANWKNASLIYQVLNAETIFRKPILVHNPFSIGPEPTLTVPIMRFDGFYFRISVPAGEAHRFSMRYDEFTIRYDHPIIIPATSQAWVLNYTYTFKKHHKFSLEHVILDTQEWSLGNADFGIAQRDAEDDHTLLNYTFSF